jgi:hypothetical protein
LSKKGNRVRCPHTPDFFVLRRDSAGWEECKTEEELVKLATDSPHRYVRDQDGSWRCPPGEEYAQKYGLYYYLRSSKEINLVRLRNFTWLEPYFCGKSKDIDSDVSNSLISLVKAAPGITFAELLNAGAGANPDEINILIATEQVYVNLSVAPLAEPDRVRIFLNQTIALSFEQITQTLPLTTGGCQVIKFDSGITLSWDGVDWEIINTGAERIGLLRADGKVVNLLYTEINDMIDRGEIKGFETQTE